MFRTNGIKSRLLISAASIALLSGGVSVMTAQQATAQDYTTGLMRGHVQDASGTPVAGATVVIKSEKGVNSTVVTNSLGEFRLMRLPGDTYNVSVSKAGYGTLSDQDVVITAGRDSQATFTLSSDMGNVEEVYVVGTSQGAWDFNSTTSGITVNVDELFEHTPVARNINDIALLTPGSSKSDSRFGNNASFNGSSAGENVFYVNGFNITDVSNMIGSIEVPFEMYESVEVKTGGYSAEFGRSTGGVVNAVTKSGSNEFHFGGNVFYNPNWGRKQSPNITSNNNSHNLDENTSYNIWASGAIVEDKLFFYGMFNPNKTSATSYGITEAYVQTRSDPFYGMKIDFVPFDGHRFEYTRFDTSTQTDTTTYDFNVGGVAQADITDAASLVGGAKGESFGRAGGEVDVYRYTGVLTDWFTISGMYGTLDTDSTAQSTADDLPVIYNYVAGDFIPRGGWVNFSAGTKTESREAYRIDADFYFDLAGEHHVRVGYDNEQMNLKEFAINSGGAYYLYWNGDYPGTAHDDALPAGTDVVRVRTYSNGGSFDSTQSALYIQDSWQASDDLTINLGIRNETFKNRNAAGEVFINTTDQLALRAGFSYDVASDSTSRLFGSFGRYHLPIAANTAYRQAGGEIYEHHYYLMTGIGAGGVPTYDPASEFAADIYGTGSVPETATFVDANVQPMYSDEWMLGYEKTLDNGWTLGARLIHRYIGSLMEDVAIDAAVPTWAAANGYLVDDHAGDDGILGTGDDIAGATSVWSGFHQYVITNPGNDMVVSTNDLRNLDGTAAGSVEMTLPAADLLYPKGKREYTALDISFAREWDGVWSLQGSYTLSRSHGNYEGNIKSDNGQDDAGITTDFDQPGLTDGAEGKLPNHRAHRLKAWGSYQVTDYLNVGARVDIESPRLQGCLGVHPTDGFAAAYGNASWYCDGVLTPRAQSMKTGWTKRIDLSFGIKPAFVEDIPGDLLLRVDVFNIFNSQTASRNVEVGSSPYYGDPANYQSPRSLRLSLNYRYQDSLTYNGYVIITASSANWARFSFVRWISLKKYLQRMFK